MGAGQLLFNAPYPAPASLLFGGIATDEPDRVDITITGSFAPLTVSAQIARVEALTVTGTFDGFTVTASMQYRSNAARPTVNTTTSPWEVASNGQDGIDSGHSDATAAPTGQTSKWEQPSPMDANIEHLLPDVLHPDHQKLDSRFERATGQSLPTKFAYQEANRAVRLLLNDAFERASLVRHGTQFRHQDGTRIKQRRESKWQDGTQFGRVYDTDFQKATRFIEDFIAEFERGRRPPAGVSPIPVKPVDPPPDSCYTPHAALLFATLWDGSASLLFKCDEGTTPPGGTIVVPVQEVYIVTNNVWLRRVDDNTLVPTTGMTLALDVDSWTWTFSASLPGYALELVEPTIAGPVELKCSVNGTEFRVLAEKLSRERTFGKVLIKVSGRGKNAVLDSPYAPVLNFGNEESRTANQLMEDVLTFNGIPLGWAINWQLTDWVVPAGVFSHQGSYISALGAIAKAAGGFLLPHPSANSFTVKHLYPTAPWNWGSVSPDFVLPADVTVREGLEWVEKAPYTRVYVSGQKNGRLGRVTRSGTDGSVVAPMVVDQLITDAQASRQRGIAILADTGRQVRVGLRLPVLNTTGVIQPGAFVRYEDGGTTRLGIVRSTSVDMRMPDVWQSLEVETRA